MEWYLVDSFFSGALAGLIRITGMMGLLTPWQIPSSVPAVMEISSIKRRQDFLSFLDAGQRSPALSYKYFLTLFLCPICYCPRSQTSHMIMTRLPWERTAQDVNAEARKR